MKTSELTGRKLDYAVALAVGFKKVDVGYFGTDSETPEQKDLPEWFNEETDNSVGEYWVDFENQRAYHRDEGWLVDAWTPSTDWSQGGPLIEEYELSIKPSMDGIGFVASKQNDGYWAEYGETYLEAACRALVAYKLGPEVSIPEELEK